MRLSVAQATQVAAQAARGLAHAHARGLVHRDIKPANLLFDDEGRVRVADFGVARALAEGAWTEPAGATVGTARYASPEQAQGLVLDGRADVYSLALVAFESLTGYVPFVLDTAMGTLAARIGATLPGHGALGPLQPVLGEAASPDVAHRPDASTFAARLEALGATLPRPQALPVAGPVRLAMGPPTMAGLPGTEHGVPTMALGTTPGVHETRMTAGPDQVFDVDAFEPPSWRRRRAVESRERRRRPWTSALVALVILALVAAGLLVALNRGVFTPSHPVPRVTGMTLAEAQHTIAGDHFSIVAGPKVSSISVKAGHIVTQRPGPGASLKQGSTITVALSSGLPIETIPSLLGVGCNGATRLLQVNHLKASCPAAAAGYSASVPIGQVINWSYDNKLDAKRAPYGATVLIALSKGVQPKTIPNVQGMTYAQAQAALQADGLQATESSASSTTTPAGDVDHTSPAIGAQVPPGTTVTVYVSSGPPTVVVPNVSGDTVSQAQQKLAQYGLSVGNVYGPKNGHVFTTVPDAGQTVTQGTAVNLYTS